MKNLSFTQTLRINSRDAGRHNTHPDCNSTADKFCSANHERKQLSSSLVSKVQKKNQKFPVSKFILGNTTYQR